MRDVLFWVPFGIFAVDFATKWIARIKLAPAGAIDIIPGYFGFTYVHNSGVAFGLFNDIESAWKPYILSAIAFLALIGIVLYGIHVPRNQVLLRSALAITTGGIMGNFVDRLLRGYVIDFIDCHIHDAFVWPTFNIADSAITVGVSLLILGTIKQSAVGRKQSTVS